MMRLFLILLFALAPSSAANAQDWNCRDAGNLPQQGMNFCAFKGFEKADAELNATWKQVFPKTKTFEAEVDEQFKGWPDALLKAQRAWITYRDAHCTSEGFKFRGGSMEPFIYNSCRAGLTQERTKQLKYLMEEG